MDPLDHVIPKDHGMAQQIFETVGIEFNIGEGGEHRFAGEAVGFRVGDIDLSAGHGGDGHPLRE